MIVYYIGNLLLMVLGQIVFTQLWWYTNIRTSRWLSLGVYMLCTILPQAVYLAWVWRYL